MRPIIFFLLLTIIVSCTSNEWSETSQGVQFKIAAFTDDTIKVTDQSVVVFQGNSMDTLYMKSANSVSKELFSHFRLHDSVVIANGADKLGFSKDTAISFRVIKVMMQTHWDFSQKFPFISSDMSLSEQEEFMNLLLPYRLDSLRFNKGMLMVHQVIGTGKLIEYSQKLTVNFRQIGIENSIKKQIIFTLGKPDQVVKGFEYGLTQMKVNGKAVFIIPSNLAFGAEGASSGVVKPHQPVAFEVEVVSVD